MFKYCIIEISEDQLPKKANIDTNTKDRIAEQNLINC